MVEKWCKTLDEGGETSAVLTGFSKAFDCTDHNLLIPKLNAYGFEQQPINFIYSCPTNRKKRTKVDPAVSSWETFFSGVSRLRFRTTFIQYIYIYIYIYMTSFLKYQQILTLCWICRWQYSLHILFRYRKCARQSTGSIRKNVSLVFSKSLGSKCRKMSPVNNL